MPTDSVWMAKSKLLWLVTIATLCFVATALIGVAYHQYWVWAIPPALIVVYLAIFKLDLLLLAVYFLVPISIVSDNTDMGISFALPSEPMLFGIMLFFFFKLLIEGHFDKAVLNHPIVMAVIAYFAWMGITSITSSMPLVSLKFMLSHLWGMVTYVLLGSQLFKKYNHLHNTLWLFIAGFTLVIAYTLIRHAGRGFSLADSSKVLTPFMWNHGIYGAVLTFIIPYLGLYAFRGKKFGIDNNLIPIAGILTVLWLIALFFSYTRAAWLGLFAAMGFTIILYFRVSFYKLIALAVMVGGLSWLIQDVVLKKLETNNKTSNKELGSHVKSIGNVKTDVSNLERVNRWSSGFRMLKERPILGWGPGTYMFQYAPFQNPWEKTPISTNFGEVGSIHSEFFGPLVEMGIIGFLLFIIMNMAAIATGMQLYYHGKTDYVRYLALAIMLGLITYLVHGLVNNFLDWDKASLVFWSSFGMLTSLSVYHNKS